RIAFRVGVHHLRLDADQLLEVWLIPVAANRVLIRTAPYWIDQLQLLTKGGAHTLLCLLIAVRGQIHRIFDGIGVEILVTETPAGIRGVILRVEVLVQRRQQVRRELRTFRERGLGFWND